MTPANFRLAIRDVNPADLTIQDRLDLIDLLARAHNTVKQRGGGGVNRRPQRSDGVVQ